MTEMKDMSTDEFVEKMKQVVDKSLLDENGELNDKYYELLDYFEKKYPSKDSD